MVIGFLRLPLEQLSVLNRPVDERVEQVADALWKNAATVQLIFDLCRTGDSETGPLGCSQGSFPSFRTGLLHGMERGGEHFMHGRAEPRVDSFRRPGAEWRLRRILRLQLKRLGVGLAP